VVLVVASTRRALVAFVMSTQAIHEEVVVDIVILGLVHLSEFS